MKRKEITSSLFVIINGKSVPWENLSETQQKEISIDLNRRAMEAIGFRVKDGQKTDTNQK